MFFSESARCLIPLLECFLASILPLSFSIVVLQLLPALGVALDLLQLHWLHGPGRSVQAKQQLAGTQLVSQSICNAFNTVARSRCLFWGQEPSAGHLAAGLHYPEGCTATLPIPASSSLHGAD